MREKLENRPLEVSPLIFRNILGKTYQFSSIMIQDTYSVVIITKIAYSVVRNLNNSSSLFFLRMNEVPLYFMRLPILLVIGGKGRIFVRLIIIFLKIIPLLQIIFVGCHSIIYNTIHIKIIKQPIQ